MENVVESRLEFYSFLNVFSLFHRECSSFHCTFLKDVISGEWYNLSLEGGGGGEEYTVKGLQPVTAIRCCHIPVVSGEAK